MVVPQSSLLILALLLVTSQALPFETEGSQSKGSTTIIKVKSGFKVKEEQTLNLDLLEAEDNLVEADAPDTVPLLTDVLVPPPPPSPASHSQTLESHETGDTHEADFPVRSGFITGHRIPLELFSDKTRAQLAAEEDTSEGKYVDSSVFRRPSVGENEELDAQVSESLPPIPSRFIQPPFNLNEALLGLESDRAFDATLDRFFPDSDYY